MKPRRHAQSGLAAAFSGKLNKRISAYIIAFSSIITLLGTSVQLGYDYLTELELVDARLAQVSSTHSLGIAQSLWNFDTDQIAATLAGILQIQDITYVAVRETESGKLIEAGKKAEEEIKQAAFDVIYKDNGQVVGSMLVQASLAGVNHRIYQRILTILAVQGIKTFIVVCFILYVFYVALLKHLQYLATYARSIELGTDGGDAVLDRVENKHTQHDELAQLVDALNVMRTNINNAYAIIRKNEKELELHRDNLEMLVQLRTKEIEDLQARLIDSAHKSGMAEIAAEVLHKIGNILNSVGVKLYKARNSNKKIPVEKLKKISVLLQQSIAEDGQVTGAETDPVKLRLFLEKLVDNTVELAAATDSDLADLSDELSRLQEVVSQQVKYIDAPDHFQQIDMRTVVDESVALVAKISSVKLNVDVRTQRSTYIQKHCLVRAISSVLEYSCWAVSKLPAAEREIKVSASESSSHLLVSVKDNGCGFEPADFGKLFEMKSKIYGYSVDNPLHEAAVLAKKISCVLNARSNGKDQGQEFELRVPINSPLPMDLADSKQVMP